MLVVLRINNNKKIYVIHRLEIKIQNKVQEDKKMRRDREYGQSKMNEIKRRKITRANM